MVLLLMLSFAGCEDDSAAEGKLEARQFLLDSAEGFEPVADSTVYLSFDGGQISVSAGCNSQGGDYAVSDGRLVVDGLGSTLRACSPGLSEQDTWLNAFITSLPRLELSGDRLTLTGDEATLVLLDREVKDPDRPLLNTSWTINALITGDAVSGFGPGTTSAAKVLFGDDGEVHIDTGCNSGKGRYAVSGNKITLMEIPYTEKGCSTPNAEAHIQQVLRAGTLSFTIEADTLTLEHGDFGVMAKGP
jgi:heat shock protein HslJ